MIYIKQYEFYVQRTLPFKIIIYNILLSTEQI